MSFARTTLLSLTIATAFLTCLCLPFADALAQSTSLSTGLQQVGKQISTVPKFIAVICYIIGTFFAVKALLALKGFIENMEENPITKVIALSTASALLISLPYIINFTRETIGANYGSETNITSSSGSYSVDGD